MRTSVGHAVFIFFVLFCGFKPSEHKCEFSGCVNLLGNKSNSDSDSFTCTRNINL